MTPATMMATGTAILRPHAPLVLFSLGAGPLSVGQLAVRAHVTPPMVHLRPGAPKIKAFVDPSAPIFVAHVTIEKIDTAF
jgi:hypothetical protein